jgi:hypothetical protein
MRLIFPCHRAADKIVIEAASALRAEPLPLIVEQWTHIDLLGYNMTVAH